MIKRNMIIILAATLLGGTGYFVWQSTRSSDALQLSGNVDIRQLNLAFRVGGRLQALHVDEGASVKAGQVLGRLDDAPQRLARDDAAANYAALTARDALYKSGNRQEDIAQAKARLAAQQAILINAHIQLNRQRQLADSGATAKQALDDALANYQQATSQTEALRQQYQSLSRGFRVEERAEVQANKERAAAQLANAELQLADTTLIAPSDGIIMTRAAEPGSMLSAGSTVFTLSLHRPVWVRAYVDEPNLGRVAPGTKVQVYTDGRAQPYTGVIGFVSPTAEFTPKNVETPDLRTALVYRLRVVVQNPDAQLRQGMPVTVKLLQP